MSNRSSIDWLELDRLVDGRLDGDAYRELICQIDSSPDGWRQCAMAFLEHQALSKELSAFADDTANEMLPFAGTGLLQAQTNESSNETQPASLVPKTEIVANAKVAPKKKSSSVLGWLTMALCVVGGTGLGFALQSEFHGLGVSPVEMITTNPAGTDFANQKPIDAIRSETQMGSIDRTCPKPPCSQSRCGSRCLESRVDLNDDTFEGCGSRPY